MKRGLLITTGLCLVLVGGYFALSKLVIRHATLNLFVTGMRRPPRGREVDLRYSLA
jgi:hypothetical protein